MERTMKIGHESRKRRGAMVPLAAMTMVPVIGMVAFAVDIGWITVAQAELQNAADAAALAGAGPLMAGYVKYNLPNQTASLKAAAVSTYQANATTYAQTYATKNSAGGVASLTLLASDIQFGYMDGSNNYTAVTGSGVVATGGNTYYPNTINVTLRRDSSANGPLSLFFANIFGSNSINLTATASATIYGGTLNNLSPARVLPMAYDVNAWNSFVSTGANPDGTLSTDSSGNPTIQVYPSVADTGNFGELSLNGAHAGIGTTNGWMDNGISSSDVSALQALNLIPLSAHNNTRWDWRGNPGLKGSDIAEVNNYVGQTFIMPLFNAYNSDPSNYSAGTANGSHYYYQITQFVGISISAPGSSTNQVIAQPAPVTVANSLLSSSAPAGSSGNLMTIFAPPKLSR
jgi:hypothetical protein